jgi:hypothetical protein
MNNKSNDDFESEKASTSQQHFQQKVKNQNQLMKPHGIKRKSMAKYKQEEDEDSEEIKPKKKNMINRPSDTSNMKYRSS